MLVRADEQKVHQSPLYPPGTRGIPASSVSNPAVATARFSDGEKRQIVSRLGFAPHDTQSVFQARHRKRAPGAFSPCFPTGSTKLSFLEPTASSVLILAASRENTKQKRRVVPDRMHSPFFTLRSAYIRLFCPAVVSHNEVAWRANSAGSHTKNANIKRQDCFDAQALL